MPDLTALKAAGAAAIEVNAPMGPHRIEALTAEIAATEPHRVVDIGCGSAALLRAVAEAAPTATCLGIDLDEAMIERGRLLGVGQRNLRLEVMDAAALSGSFDAAICVGAGHAFGGAPPLLTRLRALVADGGLAVVGEGCWVRPPDAWCRETFGEMPQADEMAALASAAGWQVRSGELATEREWDAFEHGWTAGIELVGTQEARAFAAARRAEYARYRGVLGFMYLVLLAG